MIAFMYSSHACAEKCAYYKIMQMNNDTYLNVDVFSDLGEQSTVPKHLHLNQNLYNYVIMLLKIDITFAKTIIEPIICIG